MFRIKFEIFFEFYACDMDYVTIQMNDLTVSQEATETAKVTVAALLLI